MNLIFFPAISGWFWILVWKYTSKIPRMENGRAATGKKKRQKTIK
jgi:hypothetical protein